jgi:MFS family permease
MIGAAAGDSLGGYRRRKQAILFCLLLTTMALCCLPWLLHPKDIFSGVFWSTLCLTLHAATCPLLVGLAVSTEPTMRNQASSVLSLVTNGLGYMLGPSVCGWAAEKSIQHGWEMIWGPPISVTPILLFVCYLLELNRPQRTREEEEALDKLEAKGTHAS